MSHKDKALDKAKTGKRAPIMSKHIPDITKKDYTSMIKSIKKTGSYSSPAREKYLKSQGNQDKKRESYLKERSERYKRDGITE